MNRSRLCPNPGTTNTNPPNNNSSSEDPNRLEGYGLATNVKLLLKLIQENNEASARDQDDRKPQRMAGMITILDDVRTRIQRSQSMTGRRSMAELRRCNTDLRPARVAQDRKQLREPPVADEKERLRRELTSSLVAKKSLEALCSSLGKEKEIMASELSKKVRQLGESEELIEDLKAQNKTLLGKVQTCAAEHKEGKSGGGGAEEQGNAAHAALTERNNVLSQQLLKSLEGYRSLKRKYQNVRDENERIQETIEEIGVEVAEGLGRIQGLRRRLASKDVQPVDMEAEILKLEKMLEGLKVKISQCEKKSES